MAKIMEHKATVVEVFTDQKRVDVKMEVNSACAGCKAKELCGSGESQERLVSAYADYPEIYKVGQEVTISIEQIMGVKAVIYSYVVPLVLMLVALAVCNSLQMAELAMGLTALGVCGLYYVGLFFFRNRLQREIVFSIKKEFFSKE